MKRKKFMVLAFTAVCCTAAAGISGLTTAAASSTESVGNLSAIENRVVWHSEDITYISRELDGLHSEIDNSVFDSGTVEGIVLASDGLRRNLLTSHGIINYDDSKIVANAANLFALADKTDDLANAYAAAACRSLNDIGTYFDADANVNHESQTSESIVLDSKRIKTGILLSQSVEHLAASPVVADNITAGAAAWVNGQCIIGNGADNERAYQRGIEDGRAGNDENVEIHYTPHEHTGNSGKNPIPDGDVYYSLTNPGGCYRANGHVHNAAGICPVIDVQCSGYGGEIVHHPSCIESGSGWGTDDSHVHCGAACQICGSVVSGPYAKCTNSTTSYACNNPTNVWKVGCGRRRGDIESATVVICKNKKAGE